MKKVGFCIGVIFLLWVIMYCQKDILDYFVNKYNVVFDRNAFENFVNRFFDISYAIIIPSILGAVIGYKEYKESNLSKSMTCLNKWVPFLKKHPLRVMVITIFFCLIYLHFIFERTVNFLS